jgi:uncharacterized membrane protein
MDVYLAVAFAGIVSAVILWTGAGNLLGVFVLTFVPGYLATASLLPSKRGADWVFRIALSFGLSLSLIAFLGIGLNFTPWGITLPSIAVSIFALALALGAIAVRRRLRLAPAERLELTLTFDHVPWARYSWPERILAGSLVGILVVAGAFLASALMQPRPVQPLTELYLLGPTGNFSDYPSRLNVSQNGTLTVVVTNLEGGPTSYVLQVNLVGLDANYNVTNRTALSTFNFNLSAGASWMDRYTFSVPYRTNITHLVGIEFLLYKGQVPGLLYRRALFLVTVR